MSTAMLSRSIIAPAELRVATEAMSLPTLPEAGRCAHILIEFGHRDHHRNGSEAAPFGGSEPPA